MKQAIGSEFGNVKFDYVDSEYRLSMDERKFTKSHNCSLRTKDFKNMGKSKLKGQTYSFSAAKLERFVEFKRQTEETSYLDLYNNVWSHPKLEDNLYDQRIDKFMEYDVPRISSTVDDLVNANLLAAVLTKKACSNRKLAKMLSSTLTAMNHRWIWEEASNRKRRLCRHFLKGFCKRGNNCDFLHDSSIFCPDLQKVFLGGLPSHITESSLRQKLGEWGFTVINKPKVLRGFTPQVCLGSVEEAQRLIKKGKLLIDGAQVDVRPYEAFVKDTPEKKLPDDTKRSVFLGGLPTGTTGKDIKEELKKLDVKVVNHPLIKTGFTPQVMLGNVEQAEKLVNLKKVRIKNTLVDVRSYVNSRIGSNRSGKN